MYVCMYAHVHVQGGNVKAGGRSFRITPALTLLTYLLCVHGPQVYRMHTFPIRQSNQGNYMELRTSRLCCFWCSQTSNPQD